MLELYVRRNFWLLATVFLFSIIGESEQTIDHCGRSAVDVWADHGPRSDH